MPLYPYPRTSPTQGEYIGPDEQTTTIAPRDYDAEIADVRNQLAAAEGLAGLERAESNRINAANAPAAAPGAPAGAPRPAPQQATGFSVPRLLRGFGQALDPVTRPIGDALARQLTSVQNIPKIFSEEGAKPRELAGLEGGYGAEFANPFRTAGAKAAAPPPAAAPAAGSKTQSTTPAAPVSKVADAATAPDTPSRPQGGESIEDLRKRMGLVEYGAPARGEMRQAFGGRGSAPYKPISRDVGDGRGSFSQMEIKPDDQGRGGYENIPYIAENRIADKERGLYERGIEAGLEDISPVPPGTSRLPERGIDIRRRQEGDIRRGGLKKELDEVHATARAEMQALRSNPAYLQMSPQEQAAREDEIREKEMYGTQDTYAAWGITRLPTGR